MAVNEDDLASYGKGFENIEEGQRKKNFIIFFLS